MLHGHTSIYHVCNKICLLSLYLRPAKAIKKLSADFTKLHKYQTKWLSGKEEKDNENTTSLISFLYSAEEKANIIITYVCIYTLKLGAKQVLSAEVVAFISGISWKTQNKATRTFLGVCGSHHQHTFSEPHEKAPGTHHTPQKTPHIQKDNQNLSVGSRKHHKHGF